MFCTGMFSDHSVSEGWNTSSAGTSSPNVRTTRAIFLLRASARLGSTGVIGVGGTSAMAESGVRWRDWKELLSWRVKGAEFRHRMRGTGASPERRDLAARINGIGISSADDSDLVRRDSMDDPGSRESDANSEISDSIGGSSIMEHWRRWRFICIGDAARL